MQAVVQAFKTREILKLKVLDNAPLSAQDTAGALAGEVEGAVLVQVIGRTAVLYRAHPDHPVIKLPT